MATKLYVHRNAGFSPSPSFTPVVQGTWNSDFSATYALLDGTDAAAAGTESWLLRSVNTNSSAATICHAIAYSKPLSSTHLWSTSLGCGWLTECREEVSTQNCFTMWNVGIISNDGSTVRWQTSNMKDNTEMSTSTSYFTRYNASGYSAGSYTNVPGDRIFMEFGWDKDGAVSGSIYLPYGYVSSSDFSASDGLSGSGRGWTEISHDVTFDPEGTTYDTQKSRLMLMGVG